MSQPVPAQVCRWHPVADAQALCREAAARILAAATQAIRARGRFLLVLAGGNTPRGTYERLRAANADWAAWQIYFGDERCAPRDDASRNSHMAAGAWLDAVSIPAGQIHEIPAELGEAEAATTYTATLAAVDLFDLVLLGLGEDGHTGSLFPGHPLGDEADAPDVLAVSNAPKPPPRRVSLSARRFSLSREVFFLVAGADKRDALRRWRAGELLPAGAIRPAGGIDAFVERSLLIATTPE